MDLLPTLAQKEVAALAADFFGKELPISTIRDRRHAPAAVDGRVWAECAGLGLFGLALSEELGGAGCDLAEETLLFREIGRRLVSGPFLPTVLGARVAAVAGEREMASAILSGEAQVGLAQRRGSGPDIGGLAGPGTVVDGQLDLFDALDSRYLLLVDAAGAALVETAALGDVEQVPAIDPGIRLATAVAGKVPVIVWVPASDDRIHLRALVLAAAMNVGIAEATRDMSAEYAKVRVQFGRPIGVNQAIKHACADMAVRAEAALSQLLFAAVCVQTARADAEFQALAAKIIADRYAIENAAANIQVHGGMGYTFDHDAHLYLKRAHVLDHVFGEPTDHLARLVAQPAAQ
ncbi:MAG: acyl-CoA/acyl-ACP dehydrogenase [Frankia sp.]|nr:acyl-CoA/acyl-ACP dehydrogenase [Frankia sp.]